MFGLFERGSRSFSIILLVAAFVLVYFSRDGNFGLVRSTGTGTDKRDEDATRNEGGNEVKVLFSRIIGKDADIPEKQVLEVVAEEPPNKTQVLYSRAFGKAKEEKPCNVLYSRSLGLKDKG